MNILFGVFIILFVDGASFRGDIFSRQSHVSRQCCTGFFIPRDLNNTYDKVSDVTSNPAKSDILGFPATPCHSRRGHHESLAV